jgi:hypothetical protein
MQQTTLTPELRDQTINRILQEFSENLLFNPVLPYIQLAPSKFLQCLLLRLPFTGEQYLLLINHILESPADLYAESSILIGCFVLANYFSRFALLLPLGLNQDASIAAEGALLKRLISNNRALVWQLSLVCKHFYAIFNVCFTF